MRAAASRQGVPALCGALKPSRGCIFLSVDPKSPAHDFIRKLQTDHVPIDSAKFQQERDLGSFHCTIIHAAESQAPHVALEIEKLQCQLDADRSSSPAKTLQKSGAASGGSESAGFQLNFDILGIGSNAGCWFAIVSVPEGDSIRMNCKLCPKPFHITLGFPSSDNHSVTKDCSVMKHWSDDASLVRAAAVMNISKSVASKAVQELQCVLQHLEANRVARQDFTAVKMRLTKALINSARLAEAQAAIGEIIDDAANSADADALLDALAVQHRMTLGCRLKPEPEAHADALECLNRHKALLEGKSVKANATQRQLLQDLCEFVVSSPQEDRRRDMWHIAAPKNALRHVSLPLNFALQGCRALAGCGEPSVSSILGIAAAGFKTVVTLTERGLPAEVRAVAPDIKYKHFPISDRHAPASLADLLKITAAVQNADAPVLVHCLGGKGRTALVLAAVLMIRQAEATGVPCASGEAIAMVKDARSIIMSAEQVHMLSELWAELISGDWTCPSLPAPRIMCVGLPCSGKSTFISQMIRAFGARCVEIASQDDLGRDECERLWARNPRAGSVCVLDRCNLTCDERRVWLDICHKSPTACVFFNIDRAVCIRRSASRTVHPTLPSSRAPRIIEELAGQLQAPSLSEGFCRLDEIRSEDDLRALMNRMGAVDVKEQASFDDNVVPFPRTPHLMNLGAATEDDEIIVKRPGKDADAAVEERVKQAFKIGTHIVVEEKVDGANMGFRLMSDGSIAVQNRSHFVTSKSGEQFKRLDMWLEQHSAQLLALLESPRWVLYGCVSSCMMQLLCLTAMRLQGMDVHAAQRPLRSSSRLFLGF